MRHPGHSANLRRCSVVLGLGTYESLSAHFDRKQCCRRELESHYTCRGYHCLLDVDCWKCSLCRSAEILSPSAWRDPFVLQVHLPEKGHPGRSKFILTFINMYEADTITVVFRGSNNSKLLAQRPLRPQLALPLVQSTRRRMANRPPCRPFFRWCLGCFPLRLCHSIYSPFVGPACLFDGSRCSSMGADAVGYIQYWTVCALGRRSSGECDCREELVVVAGRAGCGPGCWVWNDPPPNTDAVPRSLHPHRRPSPWFNRDHPGSSHSTR